jgi:hypothetical protein
MIYKKKLSLKRLKSYSLMSKKETLPITAVHKKLGMMKAAMRPQTTAEIDFDMRAD